MKLKTILAKLTALACIQPGVYGEDVLKVKQKLELYEEERFRGALVRARAKALAIGERPTKRVRSLEWKHAQRKNIEMIIHDGVEVKENEDIRQAFTWQYELLFTSKPVSSGRFIKLFLDSITRLSEEVKTELEAEITELEVEKAIEMLNPGKFPGLDGLSAVL